MKLFKAATTVCCLALMGAAFTTSAMADEWNRKTTMKFSGPVEIPGVHLKGWRILPAGTYVFKLVDSPSNRHIVQISNADETTVYATILAIPNYRLKATGKTVVTFSERPAGEPEAIRAWFYPGSRSGDEFVYPKARAVELAKVTKTPVLSTVAEIPVEVEAPIRSLDEPAVVQLKEAPVAAIQPDGDEIALNEAVTPPPAELIASAKLPKTAGSLPLIAMFGLIALGGAFTLGAFSKRSA